MALRKDDPVYYKKKISDLIKQAKEEGLEVGVKTFACHNSATYLSFKSWTIKPILLSEKKAS